MRNSQQRFYTSDQTASNSIKPSDHFCFAKRIKRNEQKRIEKDGKGWNRYLISTYKYLGTNFFGTEKVYQFGAYNAVAERHPRLA